MINCLQDRCLKNSPPDNYLGYGVYVSGYQVTEVHALMKCLKSLSNPDKEKRPLSTEWRVYVFWSQNNLYNWEFSCKEAGLDLPQERNENRGSQILGEYQAPFCCCTQHTSFLPLGALEWSAHGQWKGQDSFWGNHLPDHNVSQTDSTSSIGHFLSRLQKTQLAISVTLSRIGWNCLPSKQVLGYEFPKRSLSSPIPSFLGGFLCWLGSQLPLQHSALCILSETPTCLGLWKTGRLWPFHQGQRAETQVLQKLSFDLATCHFREILREITDTVRGLGENVYPCFEQTQGFLPF